MERVLAIRLLVLELSPIVGALALAAYRQQFMAPTFFGAAIFVLANVFLSIRDGAVLERWGSVCERDAQPGYFRFWLFAHSVPAICFVIAAVVTYVRPQP